ncbi:hypothetical protein, partial [Salmonella enterica]|uniref:hypothetical protein n=1 Tax=Salmonella enterica TaxID=28901 RepID=UPI00289274AE
TIVLYIIIPATVIVSFNSHYLSPAIKQLVTALSFFRFVYYHNNKSIICLNNQQWRNIKQPAPEINPSLSDKG